MKDNDFANFFNETEAMKIKEAKLLLLPQFFWGTYYSNVLMLSAKICQFTQEDLEPNTVDVFGPNGGRALSVPRVPMNGSNEDLWSSAESLGRKEKRYSKFYPRWKLTGKAMNEKRVGKIKKKKWFFVMIQDFKTSS